MPQAKRSGSGAGGGSRKGASGKGRSTDRSSSSSARSSNAGRSRASSSRRSAGASAKRTTSSQSAAQQPRTDSDSDSGDFNANLSVFRDFLQRGMEGPLSLVMLTNERIQEVVDDAVDRGRITRDDAEELAQEMVRRGRQQTVELLADFEQLLGRGRGGLETAASAAKRSQPADRVLREVDRARRAAGLGHSFPILSYDDLTAAQIGDRLDDLSPAELRKVRDYERRHGNRKSVLQAVETKLG